ncbi:MAG TPA: HEAT repeat domain-containing protein [Kofleriaceae bacterium]|nr:HEAT repeat domain-containing protein [Kofleriaceae bacterium]
MRRPKVLTAALLGVVLASAAPDRARADDDWGVTRDPFDKNVVAKYKGTLAKNPHDPGALAKLLEMYRRYRTVAQLEKEYQAVLDKKPDDGPTLIIMARLAAARGDNAAALPLWEQASKAAPDDAIVWVELGTLYRNAGKTPEAKAAFDKALASPKVAKAEKAKALRAEADLALAANDIEGAKKLFDQMIALDPKDVQLRLELGDSLLQANKHAEAIDVYREAEKMLGADPSKRVEVVARIGQALEQKGDDDAAVVEYRRAIKLAPKGYYIENELTARIVDIYRRKQKLPDLLAEYEKTWPEGSRGHFEWDTLARLYEETGQQDKAIAAYRKAVAKAPYELETQRRLIQLLENVGKDDEALKQLEQVVGVAPGEARFQLELAERYWRKGDQKKALGALAQLQARFPGDAGVQSAIADLYTRWGKDDLALAAYERLATLEPDDPGHLVTLGEQYYSRGDKAKALATWKRIAASGKASGFAKLGEVMSEHGMTTDALANYGKAIKLEPNNPDHYKGRAAVYESIKSYADAMADWQKVMSLLGDKAVDRVARREARRRIVGVLVRWGQKETEMKNAWVQGFKRTPPDLEAGYFLVEYFAKRPQAGEPRGTLEKLHKLVADDQDVILDLVKAYRGARQFQDAVNLLQELAKVAPAREREVYTQIAEIMTEWRKDDEAIAWSQKALAKSPNDPQAYEQLAKRYIDMAKFDDAIVAYEKSIELDPRNFKAYFELAKLYVNQSTDQSRAKAAELYRKLLERASDDDILTHAGRAAIDLEEGIGSLGELEKVAAPLAFTMSHKPVYRRILVELYLRYVPRLAERARRGTPEIRKAAKEELVRLGQHGLRPLLEALHDEKDVAQQKVAVVVLGYLGNKGAAAPLIHLAAEQPPQDPDSTRRIGTLTQTLDWEVRVDALVAAGRLGDASVLNDVLPLTQHAEVAMREAAVFTAGRTGDKRAVPTLLGALADKRESVQVLACLGMAQIDDARTTSAMIDTVADRKRHDLVRATCAFGLGYRRAPGALTALLTALDDNSGEAQRIAAWSLGQLGDAKALAPLVRAYFGRADGRRDEIAWALARLADASAQGANASGSVTRGATPAAPASADLADYPVRAGKLHPPSLVAALPGPLPQAAPPVAAVIAHPDDVVAGLRAALSQHRDVVVVVLADLDARTGGLGLGTLIPAGALDAKTSAALATIGKGIAPDVAAHAGDPDPKVRALAVSVLAKLDAAGADAAIVTALGDDAPNVRASAARAAAVLARIHGSAPASLAPALTAQLKAKGWEDRMNAASALGAIGASSASAELARVLTDDNAWVREAAASSLGALKAKDGPVVDALLAATRDDVPPVRRAAAAALVAIGDPRARARLDELAKNDPDDSVRRAASGH